jgi:hypothetical protein
MVCSWNIFALFVFCCKLPFFFFSFTIPFSSRLITYVCAQLSTFTVFHEDGLVDHHVDCGAWADFGECETNDGYMSQQCADSCYHQHIIRSAVLTGKPIIVHCDSTVGPFTIKLQPSWVKLVFVVDFICFLILL